MPQQMGSRLMNSIVFSIFLLSFIIVIALEKKYFFGMRVVSNTGSDIYSTSFLVLVLRSNDLVVEIEYWPTCMIF